MKQSFGWGPNKQTYNGLSVPLGINEKHFTTNISLASSGVIGMYHNVHFLWSAFQETKQGRISSCKEVICAINKIKPRCPYIPSQNLCPKLFFPQKVLVSDCTHISLYPSVLPAFQKHWLHWILSLSCLSSPRKSWHLSYTHLGFGDQFQN